MIAAEPTEHVFPKAFKLSASGGASAVRESAILELAMKFQAEGRPRAEALELAAGEHVARILEKSDMAFLGAYNQGINDHPLRRHIMYRPANGGFAEFGDLYPTGTMQKLEAAKKDASRNPWWSANYRLVPELWRWTGEIDYTVMNRLESITDGGFSRSLQQAAQLPIQLEVDQFVSILEANSAAHLGGTSGFFSATNPIPGTSRTFVNLTTGIATASIDNIRTAIRTIQIGLLKQRGAMNMAVHGYTLDDKSVTLIAHPDKAALIEDAFEPGNIGGPNVVLNDKGRMPKWTRVYHTGLTSTSLVALVAGNYFPLVAAQGEMPNMISTLGVPGNLLKILSNAELAQVRYEFKPGFGSPFMAYKTTA